jgi:hypothetical protein
MKIIDLVFLIGSQCVSPVQHAPGITEVAKVQCAVVIERDTETNTVRVSPEGAVAIPKVAEAIRAASAAAGAVPAAGPPPQRGQTVIEQDAGVVRLDVAPDARPQETPEAGNGAGPAPEPQRLASAAAAPEPAETPSVKPVRKPAAAARTLAKEPANLCGAGRKAVWYTASGGHRKYRCRTAADAAKVATQRNSGKTKKRKSLY